MILSIKHDIEYYIVLYEEQKDWRSAIRQNKMCVSEDVRLGPVSVDCLRLPPVSDVSDSRIHGVHA